MSWDNLVQEEQEFAEALDSEGTFEMEYVGIWPEANMPAHEGTYGPCRVAKFKVTKGDQEGKEFGVWFGCTPEGGLKTSDKSISQNLHIKMTGKPYGKGSPCQFDQLIGTVANATVAKEGNKLKLALWQPLDSVKEF